MGRGLGDRCWRAPWFVLLVLALGSGCSVKQLAINSLADALAEIGTAYESDNDPALVSEALPFMLKLVDGLIAEAPDNGQLLVAASGGYLLYTHAFLQFEAERIAAEDFERARKLRGRARNLYLRALDYSLRALELDYPGFGEALFEDPEAAVQTIRGDAEQDLPRIYFTAAALGLAISVSKDSPTLLARLPEVHALLLRALDIDQAWNDGALHEFAIILESGTGNPPDHTRMEHHYQRALDLSAGKSASIHVSYAEAVSIPQQNRAQFLELMDRALGVEVEAQPQRRLHNVLAQQRAEWLLERIDELFL